MLLFKAGRWVATVILWWSVFFLGWTAYHHRLLLLPVHAVDLLVNVFLINMYLRLESNAR